MSLAPPPPGNRFWPWRTCAIRYSGLVDADVEELRGHSWSDRVISEVVWLVSLNLLTGSFNLVAGIEPQ
ncbi:hypothetical protein [Lentzea aerocolonigenes]|uniref:hypothetical protein n=1 Tax=Lentzea aerocolonigenes TaxID=68170 RepID=UPI0004C37977|nr:hypothetical protein [Lentzea aerocolonigenes]MCP2247344.1 hypothetical protein [Lentzea aerocolonigenes]